MKRRPLETDQHFEEEYHTYLQRPRISLARNQHEAGSIRLGSSLPATNFMPAF
jgi:hypothetical protein